MTSIQAYKNERFSKIFKYHSSAFYNLGIAMRDWHKQMGSRDLGLQSLFPSMNELFNDNQVLYLLSEAAQLS